MTPSRTLCHPTTCSRVCLPAFLSCLCPLQVSGMLVDLTAGNPLKDAVAQEFMSTLVTSNTHVLESPEGHR